MNEKQTFAMCLKQGVAQHAELIAEIGELASKEYVIEQALDKMLNDWAAKTMEVSPYKNTGTFIMKIADETLQLLDEKLLTTQQLGFSPFKAAFEVRIQEWDDKLRLTKKVLTNGLNVKSSGCIENQYLRLKIYHDNYRLKLKSMALWRRIMSSAAACPKIMIICPDSRLLDSLVEARHVLAVVSRGLNEYMELKRVRFPRFFFLSDDELLEILSKSRNPRAVQPHLRKCFENIAKVTFEPDLKITQMHSSEGVIVELKYKFYPTSNVEQWLLLLEDTMRHTSQLKEHQIRDHNPFEEVLPLCSTEHLINLPKNKARPPIKDVACHAISDTYEGVTLVIQEGLLCRECDTPLDSDKHFLGRTSRSKCPYATSCYRAMLRHSGYCAGSLSLEAAPRPAPTLYCVCEYSTDISTDILSHLLVTQHTSAYLTEELARANTVREEPKPADEVEPMIPVYAEGCELTANVLLYMDHLKQHQDKELEIKCTRCVLRFVRLGQLKEHQIRDHNPFEEVLPLCSTEHLIKLPKNKARPPIKDVACHAISDTYEGVTLVIQEGLLCRECDTPLDSDKHFLGHTSRSKCPYATSCYRAMLRHSGYCAGSLSLEAAPRPAPTLYCVCEYSTDISTDILSHLLVTQHTSAYLTEELARANTVREEPKPADEVEPIVENMPAIPDYAPPSVINTQLSLDDLAPPSVLQPDQHDQELLKDAYDHPLATPRHEEPHNTLGDFEPLAQEPPPQPVFEQL